ncbi:hypothetical protein FRC09_001053 [Ceratobasidium sp. 395]|nr:hypothetical protein FRC09_001053 [Ceratobasidium sp. 395]
MSHRPRKRARPAAEPIPAVETTPAPEPTLAATQSAVDASATPIPSQKPAPNDPVVAALIPDILGMVESLKQMAVTAAKLEPGIPRYSFTIIALAIRRQLVGSIDLLDEIIDASQPGRTFSCIKRCHLKTSPLPPSPPPIPKPVDHKSIATDAPSPLPTPPPPLCNPATVTKSYADVAAGTTSDLAGSPLPGPSHVSRPPRSASRPSARKGPVAVLPPIRLIIRRADPTDSPFPLAYLFANGPSDPYHRLRLAMFCDLLTRDTPLLGLHRTRRNNAVVSLPHGTPDHVVDAVADLIKLELCRTPDSSRSFPLLVTRDVPWVKLMVSSVPARCTQGSRTYSEEEVRKSFSLNPAIQSLKITRAPRWVRNPASITGMHSSFTFSFEDPDGSLARSLAKSHLFVLGEPVHLKRWIDNPMAKRDVSQKTGLSRPALRMPPADGMEE